MRENMGIYRGKRVDNEEWREGYLYINPYNQKTYIIDSKNSGIFPQVGEVNSGIVGFYEVIPETVGQYTGEKDKNGKKIWEGDIVKGYSFKEPFIKEQKTEIYGIVTYHDGCFVVDWQELPEGFKTYPSITNTYLAGNIFDNPELLEEKEI